MNGSQSVRKIWASKWESTWVEQVGRQRMLNINNQIIYKQPNGFCKPHASIANQSQ
jgi:hypothetical protein